MIIEIVSTGDEVITGMIDDTNATFLSHELIQMGLQVNRRHTVGDNLDDLINLFTDIAQRKTICLVTGGLGPTNDDYTSQAISKVANAPLELNDQWVEQMTKWFQIRGRAMADTNLKQAMVPKGSLIINNPIGTACGFLIKINQALFIFAPGVPKELKAMWETSIKEIVLSCTKTNVPRTHFIRIFLMGIAESNLATIVEQIVLPESISIGDRAIYPFIELKIIGHNASDQDMLIVLQQLMEKVSCYFVCKDQYTLIEKLNDKQIVTQEINAVDGLCNGWFLIKLQEIFNNFGVCSLLNYKNQKPHKQYTAQAQYILNTVHNHNTITLLPYENEDPQEFLNGLDQTKEFMQGALTLDLNNQEQINKHKYKYQMNLDFVYLKDQKPRSIKANLVLALTEPINSKQEYARNRDFIASLCCVEIYKFLVQERLVIPENCLLSLLNYEDQAVE